MKIAHLTATAAAAGGLQAHLAALVAEQDGRGDDVSVVHVNEGADMPPGVETIRLHEGDDVVDRVARLRPEVVHLHGTPFSPAVERELQARFPTVRSLHDFSFACSTGEHWFRSGAPCVRSHGPGCLAGVALRGCAHRLDVRPALRAYRRLDASLDVLRDGPAVVVYSEYMRGIAVANGIDETRCRAVPCFVHAPGEPPQPATGRTVAFVGRIVGSKGLAVLIDALARRQDAWDTLLVVGDGWDRARCERLATGLGIGGRVEFLGWLAPRRVGEVLRRAALLALPSRWPEPFGIVGLEALAAGRPVVASRIGGIPEWLDESAGRLVPAGDADLLGEAVAALLSDGRRLARLGAAGRDRAAQFSPARHLAALDAVYRTVT